MNETTLLCTSSLEEALYRAEYECQLFDGPTISLSYSVTEVIKIHIQKVLAKLQDTLLKKVKNSNYEGQIHKVMMLLREKYEMAVDKHCKEMEAKLFKIFHIPSHVLLPEDQVQINQFTEDDEKQLDEEIKELKSRYEKAAFMELLLKNEKKKYRDIDSLTKASMVIHDDLSGLQQIIEFNEQYINSLMKELEDYRNLEVLGQQLGVSSVTGSEK